MCLPKSLLSLVAPVILCGCASAPVAVLSTTATDLLAVDVATKQTEITATAKDIEANIDAVKIITDSAKLTGEIPKEKTESIITYIDTSESLVKKLNTQVSDLTNLNNDYAKSRISDNAKTSEIVSEKDALISKWTDRANIRLKWAVVASIVSTVLVALIFLPKIIK